MSKLKTAIAFSKNLLTTGALFQTSSKVEQAITSKVSSSEPQLIVEFGMGHGNITAEILKKMHPSSKLYTFEINEEFCELVKEKIKDDRLTIINAGAEEIATSIEGKADIIVSSIPLTIFPKEKTAQILNLSYEHLESGAFFSQIQYSRVLKKKFEHHFDQMDVDQVSKIPPEFIYHCKKN